MVKYRGIYLKEIKALLSYFVKFKKDSIILSKEYVENCAVEGLDQQVINIIMYSKNVFSVNDSCQKVWIFERYEIFCPKRKRRGIMMSDFLLPWFWLNLLSLFLKR